LTSHSQPRSAEAESRAGLIAFFLDLLFVLFTHELLLHDLDGHVQTSFDGELLDEVDVECLGLLDEESEKSLELSTLFVLLSRLHIIY
jgi:hypothetical protein